MSPWLPNKVMKTFASVPAPDFLAVCTNAGYISTKIKTMTPFHCIFETEEFESKGGAKCKPRKKPILSGLFSLNRLYKQTRLGLNSFAECRQFFDDTPIVFLEGEPPTTFE